MEHQETCGRRHEELSHVNELEVWETRGKRLINLANVIVDKLIRNEPLPVKDELGQDFCDKCTSFAQHDSESCFLMTRVQALEAVFPNYEHDAVTNEENKNKVMTNAIIEDQMEERERERAWKQRELNQIVRDLISERISDSSILSEIQEQREEMMSYDEETAQMKIELEAKYDELRSSLTTSMKEQIRNQFQSARQRLMAEERSNPSGLMIRFMSTHNPDE